MSCIRHKAFRSHAAVIFIDYNERRDLVSGVAFILTCSHMTAYDKNIKQISTFTFMHLADEFIQSDLQCIQAINYFKLLKL